MDVKEAMDLRISLRAYDQKPIEQEKLSQLQEAIDVANAQMAEVAPDHPAILTIEGPHLEDGTSVHMKNKSIVGPIYHYVAGYCEDAIARELIGYYGEKIVLLATQLGIGSCWIAETMDWKTLARDEYNGLKLGIIISIGYAPEKIPLKQEGIRTAIRLRTKKPAQIMTANGEPTEPEKMPEWFNRGINAVLACPTAINKLPVVFDLTDGVVSASMPNQRHLVQDYDLGISKLHFELAADLKGTWELGQPGRFIVSEERAHKRLTPPHRLPERHFSE